jgi:DNA uptake protein ComE-like DNA-binding protein
MGLKVGQTAFHRSLGREVEIFQEFSSHFQCKDGKTIISASKTPGIDLLPPREFEVIDNAEVGENSEDVETKTININEVSAANLGKALKGVGRFAAARIIERKPEGGYMGIEQLKMLNADVNINWEAVLPHVTFS